MRVAGRVRHAALTVLVALLLGSFVDTGWSAGPSTSRVSVSSQGVQANGDSAYVAISANGRFVAFYSAASNLVPGDTNNVADVFVRDRNTNETRRVSVSSSGVPGDKLSYGPAISADGRFVTFTSSATNFAPNDANNVDDVFVRDRKLHKTTRVSLSSQGAEANASAGSAGMSANGRFVVFSSSATNLVAGDNNGEQDIFLRDRKLNKTTRVSVSSSGAQGNALAYLPAISGNGRFVAFSSDSTNLVPNDINTNRDILVHDRNTGKTTRADVSSSGGPPNDTSDRAAISGDGRFVTFHSFASNLVPSDTNAAYDVFERDRKTHTTKRVSVTRKGAQVSTDSFADTVSGDGRFVAFSSYGTGLVAGDTNGLPDLFVRDMQAGTNRRVNVSSAGAEANANSSSAVISGDARFVAFGSNATNLVTPDAGGHTDLFVRGPLR